MAAYPTVLDLEAGDELSLLEIVDHVLNTGIVVQGSLIISLAGVDLIYLGLNVVVTSVETAQRHLSNRGPDDSAGIRLGGR